MSENINENSTGYNENIISEKENEKDTRYDKYAAPSSGLDGNMFNGRKARFNPYTGEPIPEDTEMNGSACTTDAAPVSEETPAEGTEAAPAQENVESIQQLTIPRLHIPG